MTIINPVRFLWTYQRQSNILLNLQKAKHFYEYVPASERVKMTFPLGKPNFV